MLYHVKCTTIPAMDLKVTGSHHWIGSTMIRISDFASYRLWGSDQNFQKLQIHSQMIRHVWHGMGTSMLVRIVTGPESGSRNQWSGNGSVHFVHQSVHVMNRFCENMNHITVMVEMQLMLRTGIRLYDFTSGKLQSLKGEVWSDF